MPEIPKRFVKRAVANIVAHGDTDVFPFPFENILIRRNQDDFVDLICSLSETFKAGLLDTPPQFESTLAPSGYSGYRWVTQICPFWNCYLLAAVLRHAEQIEAARIPVEFGCVHSYRLNASEESEDLFRPEYNWRSFMLASLEAAKKSRFVVLTDISEFYRRIYHHRVENAMEQICSTNIPDKIIDLLKIFSRGSSYGLPIGGPAARIISELVLNQVDHLLRSKGINFCRFADDFHVFTDSEEGAYKSLQTLSEMLIVNQGLTLQKSKTRIMPSAEFISTFPAHLIPGATPSTDRERLFHVSLSYDPYSPTAASDYEALRESLGSIDFLSLLDDELAKSQVHGPTVSKLIKALRAIEAPIRSQAINTMLNNISVLYPVFSQLLMVINSIRDSLTEGELRAVCGRLIELSRSGSYLMALDLHRCFSVRILRASRDPRVDELFDAWFQNGSQLMRRDIIIAYAARSDWLHLSDLKNRMSGDTPWVRRSLIAGSYVLRDEGKHWRNAQKFSVFESFVAKCMQGMQSSGEVSVLL